MDFEICMEANIVSNCWSVCFVQVRITYNYYFFLLMRHDISTMHMFSSPTTPAKCTSLNFVQLSSYHFLSAVHKICCNFFRCTSFRGFQVQSVGNDAKVEKRKILFLFHVLVGPSMIIFTHVEVVNKFMDCNGKSLKNLDGMFSTNLIFCLSRKSQAIKCSLLVCTSITIVCISFLPLV